MNESESIFVLNAESKGYKVIRNGWPDFALMGADGSLLCVEVKSKNNVLRQAQKDMIEFLKMGGIPCFVSRDGEFPDFEDFELGLDKRCEKCGINPHDLERKLLGNIESKYQSRLVHLEENLRRIRKLCDE